MANITVIPSNYTGLTGMTIDSSYGINRAYTDSSSTTYARFNINVSTKGYIYFTFNTSSIPSTATISSVSAQFKARVSNTNRVTSTGAQLYSGTTAKGSSTAFANTTASVRTITAGTWTRAELNDLRLYVTGTGSSSGSSKRIDFYGADVTITYTVASRTITTTLNGSGSISPSGTTTVNDGDSFALTINATNPTVTDNNVDVTSQLERITSGTETFVSYDYENSGFTISNITNAYTDINDSTYANCDAPAGSTTSHLYLNLGPVNIPSNATISSVSCQASLQISRNGSSSGMTASCQLYSGNTAKGSATSLATTATDVARTTYTLNIGTWTAAELQNARFRVQFTNNASGTHRYIYIYGVSLTVTYTVSGEVYLYTISNVTGDHTIVVTAGSVVPISVTGVTVSPTTVSLEIGETQQLTATVSPSNATDKTVSWSSNNTSVATVSSSGLITAISSGSATITVTTTDGNKTATCLVTVAAAITYTYKLATSMVVGKKYLIANGSTGSVYLLSNESGGSRQLVGVAATVYNNKITITAATKAKTEFECIRYTSGNDNTITVQSNNQYLYTNNSTGLRMNSPTTLDRFWHYQNNKFWQFKSTTDNGYTDTSSEYKYYLELNSSNNFTDNHVTSPSIEDTTLPAMYIFVEDDGNSEQIYIKINGTWTAYSKVYLKVNGTWVEQDSSTWSTLFNTNTNYRKIN